MNVLTAGTSGLIGHELAEKLGARGDRVVQLVRRKPTSEDERAWDPDKGDLDPALLDDIDAVVCLSGVGVADGRWTPSVKEAILASRISTVGLLARAIANHPTPPGVFVSASAIGYYGSSLSDTPHDESSPPGDDFLADVCRQWEDAASPATNVTRCVQTRIGVVITQKGGALKKMLPAFRMGVGGPLSTGKQTMSWISLEDVTRGILHALEDDTLDGPIDLCAPNPVTNEVFSRSLAKVLHRPCVARVPGFVIRAALGEMGETLLLNGTHVIPGKLLSSEFRFQHATIEQLWESEFA